jgi:xylulokinase
MADPLWLVLDIGTSGVKAALVREDARIMQTAVEHYPTHNAAGGIVEQNVGDWWKAVVVSCITLGSERASVSAIVVTGQMQDLVLVDENGSQLLPVILYSDTRSRSEASEIVSRIGADRLRVLTSNEQGADSLWAKLLWVERHAPDARQNARALLFGAADYVIYRLTGTATTDTTTASTTGLLHGASRCWFDAALLEEMGIGGFAPLLPALVPGGAAVGALEATVAATLGVPSGVTVYHAPGDAGSTTLGAGSGEIGQAYGYLGTSGWLGFTASAPGSPEQGVFTLAHPRAESFIQVAPLLTAGGNLEWVRGLFGAASYETIIASALERPMTNVIYLPYLNGERSPFVDPLARAAFIGMSPATEQADLVRAVLEGVAFSYKHALDALLPDPPERLILTGGGTRSLAWCQVFADVLGVPLALISEPEHVAVRGALLSAQVAQGRRASYARAEVEAAHILQPDPVMHDLYVRKYALYREAYPALKPLFASGADIYAG